MPAAPIVCLGMTLAAILVAGGCVGIASQMGEPRPCSSRCAAGFACIGLGTILWVMSLGRLI